MKLELIPVINLFGPDNFTAIEISVNLAVFLLMFVICTIEVIFIKIVNSVSIDGYRIPPVFYGIPDTRRANSFTTSPSPPTTTR